MTASNAGPARGPKKGTLKQVVIITALVAAASLAIAGAIALAGGVPRRGRLGAGSGAPLDEVKSLPAHGVARISIQAVSEDVRVTVGPADTVEARLHGQAGARDPAAVPRLSAEVKGDAIEISVDREQALSLHWSRLALDVTIPSGYAGDIAVGTVSGDVTLPALSSRAVTVKTVSGDARLAAIRCSQASFHTTSGSLRAEALEAARVELTSVSGDMTVARLRGSARASSTSGDISLSLLPDAAFQLDARSVSGRVSCAFPITLSGAQDGGGRHALVGTVGDGRDEITVSTVSGDIALKR
jgi:lia operon protein LiaG